MEEIYAVRRERGEKFVSDNSKCIRTSEGTGDYKLPISSAVEVYTVYMDVSWNDPLCHQTET
jgi:hypothetical protein